MIQQIDFHLGRRLRRRRRLLGLSQEQLGAYCGVRLQQIQKYECGESRISAGRLWQLSAALAVPIDYFFEGATALQAAASEKTAGQSGQAITSR